MYLTELLKKYFVVMVRKMDNAKMNEKELILETVDLCKNFGPTVALNNVNLKVYRGQITGLIGENGSGKSTITSCPLPLSSFD